MHLTGRGYAWLIVIAVLGISAQWVSAVSGTAWRVLAAGLVVLLWLEGWSARRRALSITRAAPLRTHLGRALHGTLTLANPQSQRLRVRAVQPLPPTLAGTPAIVEFNLDPGEVGSQAWSAVAGALGQQAWAPLYTRVRGSCGLAWWERRIAVPGKIDVVPDALTAQERRAASNAGGDRGGTYAGPGLELLGLRDYAPGDPLRMLDWKATARSGRPCVRVYAHDMRLEMLLLLDCSRRSALQAGNLSRLHHSINVAARLAEHAARNRDPVGLLTFADSVIEQQQPAIGDPALARLRNALGRMAALPGEPALLEAALAARKLLGNRTLIVLFTDLDVEDRDGQWLSALRLLMPKHLPLVACLLDEETAARSLAPAVHWRDPFDILAATEIEHSAAANRVHARRLGAQVVAARAGDLDGKVLAAYARLRRQRRV